MNTSTALSARSARARHLRALCTKIAPLALLAMGCGNDTVTASVTVEVATADAFGSASVGTLRAENPYGDVLTSQTVSVPATAVEVSNLQEGATINVALSMTDPSTGLLLAVGETGLFATGTTRSLFLQRTGGFYALPNVTFPMPFSAPRATFGDGTLLAAFEDGTQKVLDGRGRRTGTLGVAVAAPPSGYVSTLEALLVIEGDAENASAQVLDLATRSLSTLAAPANLRFADLAWGASVTTGTGGGFLVGGTRAVAASARGLRASANGTLEPLLLQTARKRAAITYLPKVGLVVVGGAATAPGAELLLEAQTNGVTQTRALSTTPDEREGLALAAWDSQRVLEVDEAGGVSVLDTVCAPTCAPLPLANLPAATSRSAVALGPNDVLVGGVEAGTFVVHRVRASGTTIVPLPAVRATGTLVRAFPSAVLLVSPDGAPFLFRPESAQ